MKTYKTASDALAEAIREIIDYEDGCAYIYGHADTKVPLALAEYDAEKSSQNGVSLEEVEAWLTEQFNKQSLSTRGRFSRALIRINEAKKAIAKYK